MKGMLVFKIVFTGIGSLFLGIAIFFLINGNSFMKSAIKTEGKVIYAGRRAEIAFTTKDGKQIKFHSQISCNPPCYKLNEIVNVYYNKNNPYNARIDSFSSKYLLPFIFGFIGLIFFSIGMGFIVFSILTNKKKEELLKFGIKQKTDFVEVVKNTSLKVNGRSPYVIYSEWLDKDNNQVYSFKSENIWFNPKKYLKEGDKIIVYLDKNNYKRYYMDISFLPKRR